MDFVRGKISPVCNEEVTLWLKRAILYGGSRYDMKNIITLA